jgi:glycine/D-amino acid oxidase-like deaminating enzyme
VDLRSGQPFWPLKSGLLGSYPKLTENLVVDVAVLGAGVTGALCAHRLAQAGLSVTVLDTRDVARGSTSASTALLQYTHLTDLAEIIGLEDAERAYRLCRDAIHQLAALTQELGDPCGFERKPSLYFASSDADAPRLEAEYEARCRAGFQLELWDGPTPDARLFRFGR